MLLFLGPIYTDTEHCSKTDNIIWLKFNNGLEINNILGEQHEKYF